MPLAQDTRQEQQAFRVDTDTDDKLRIKSPGKTKVLKARSRVEGTDGWAMSSRGTALHLILAR